MLRNMTGGLFEKYGRECEFIASGDAQGDAMKAFISPLRYKNKMYLYGVNTEIGFNPEGYYLYIGPPSPDITRAQGGARIVCDGEAYRIDRAEKVYLGGSVFHIWAVIRKTSEGDDAVE